MRIALISMAALALAACGADDVDSVEGEGIETRERVQKMVVAPGAPGDKNVEVEVIIGYASDVDREHARALLDNIRIVQVNPDEVALLDTPDDFSQIPPQDLHWVDPEEHGIHVEVNTASDRVDRYRWVWIDEAEIDLHCPPWH